MKKSLITIVVLTLPVLSLAAEKGGYKKMRYGMAGCGFTSIFIQKNEMLPQIGKAAADWYFALGSTNTSAMTTGTSNCTNNPSEAAMLMEQQVFVSMNYNSINKEAAQGAGEHLTAFAQVLGCNEAEFAEFTKANHAQIFSGAEGTLENVKTLIQKGETLSCERV